MTDFPSSPVTETVLKALEEAREEVCKTTHNLTVGYKLDGFDFAAEAVLEALGHAQTAPVLTLLSPSDLPMESDPDVLQVARAIAERGIGRYWDDFPETDAFDTDQGDLIEYARAAVEIFRRTALSDTSTDRGGK